MSSQKDEKINSLEEKIKNKADKNIADLTINSGELNILNFVETKNKWKVFDDEYKCCENNCVNTDNPKGVCIEGNGFANLISDGNIKYINCVEKWGGLFGFGRKKSKDQFSRVIAETSFKNPKNSNNYSLFYFEVKSKIEKESDKWMFIGLKNNNFKNIILYSNKALIICENEIEEFNDIVWKDDSSFGCGLVYPPTKSEEFPYIFFTQNGKQIGKAILLKNNYDYYLPFVTLQCCSVETNFGTDLGAKPFEYDISKHSILKDFY
uniref:SPRY domain-containing protein n=1 Tax=Meloidogyne incognita TaxID=6306 RepID=A0A914MGN1_MELIC